MRESFELLSTSQMAAADRLSIEGGAPGIDLMEEAGRAVADAARRMLAARGGRRVLALCGPGNNGGDGFVAARILRQQGFDVLVALLFDRAGLKGDALEAARRWPGRVTSAQLVTWDGVDLVIDALFGAGLARDLDGRARVIVERLNAQRATGACAVLAVDTPSGVDGDSGQVRGVAVEADATVTFFRLKPGHLLLPGRDLCGPVTCADIGIRADVLASIEPDTFLNGPALWRGALPPMEAAGHKYTRGHALVVSGVLHRTGAARLAARGALRGGAGLVTLASPREALAVNAAHLTAIMLTPCDGADEFAGLLQDVRINAVVLGPAGGVGAPLRDMTLAGLAVRAPGRGFVLDADALTSFAGRLDELASAVRAFGGPVVLTPHEGEFARLFAGAEFRDGSKLARARAAAKASGAVVLLKGPDTVVAHPDGRASIARDLPAWLA
ncbi:MAG: carbohydrate kinase, YjeF related protein, partial [Hyphomicrobiales bacterium]|nr:carbohydrate kinase, YjeF related protein [Hyphomicrobiales bacterium]